MNVLIADKFERAGIQKLEAVGCTVTVEPAAKDDALRELIERSGCHVLIVRSTKVKAPMIAAGEALALIVRAGAGYDNIDVEAASSRSVFVANCPGKNAVAVAELAFGLILSLDRRIVENANDLRNGIWNKKEYSIARGLKGRTLGIVGFGQIGRAMAARAAAFEMPVVAWSRSLTETEAAEAGVSRASSPVELARQSDIVSVHLAATGETKRMLSTEFFGALRPGSTFINTARGEVVDYDALAKAVRERQLRVGLDVFAREPAAATGTFDDPIVSAGPQVYGTHHIGASTDQAQSAIADETVRIVEHFKSTGEVLHCVNLCARSPARWSLSVRHLNRPGVLAHVLNEISHAGINVEEMANVICSGATAACAQIRLDARPPDDALDRIRSGNANVLGVTLTNLGT